jgi:hypothetical protein
VLWRSARARLLAGTAPERALELVQTAVDFAETTADLQLRGDAWCDIGEVRFAVGQRDAGATSYEQAVALYERKGDATSAARARRRLDEMARAAD